MNVQEVIKQAEEHASEWIEISDNPAQIIAGVLANKIVILNTYIDHLERRLKHDSSTRAN